MPAYVQSAPQLPLSALFPGDVGYSFGTKATYANQTDTFEAVANGEAGLAFALVKGGAPFMGKPQQVSMELTFNQNPGAFNFQLQTADTDNPNYYQTEPTVGTVTAVGASSNFSVRVEAQITARFVRILCSSAPANGGTTVIGKLCPG